MLKVFDFKCSSCGAVFEETVTRGTTTCRCSCGAEATKMPSATRCVLDGASGDFPGRHFQWIREHEKAGRKPRDSQA